MAEYLCEEDMNTGEYISRDEVLRAFHQYCITCTISAKGARCKACDNADAMDVILDMPAADVQPVRRGHWIKERIDDDKSLLCGAIKNIKCSVCNKGGLSISYFCPNCGADMRETKKR